MEELNPDMIGQYKSEENLLAGGRTDATFQNISFELKKEDYFCNHSGVEEALFGRNDRDHRLHDYIIANADINSNDSSESITYKILHSIGVGFVCAEQGIFITTVKTFEFTVFI